MFSVLLLFALVSQGIFIGFFFARLAFYSPKKAENQVCLPVSVLVCARNEANHLADLIQAVLGQAYPDFEMIIINDRSADATQAILDAYALQDNRLKIITLSEIPQGWNPKKYALQIAIRVARYELLLLTDADCVPATKHWIANMVGVMKPDTEVVLGFSPYFHQKGFLNAFIQYETFYTALQYLSFALAGLPYMGVGRNLLYRKSVFLQTNPFQAIQHVQGGDDDLVVGKVAKRTNTLIGLHSESYVFSHPKITWRAWQQQKIRHLSVGVRYRLQHLFLLGALNFSQLGLWICIIGILFFQEKNLLFYTLLTLFGLRVVIQWVLFAFINRKMKAQVNAWLLPFFDFIFTIYIFTIGLIALTRKNIPWKN